MDRNNTIIILAAVAFVVAMALLLSPSFRKRICTSNSRISNYISKIIGNITAIAGLLIGTGFIIELKPIVEQYYNTTTVQTNKSIVRDTVIVIFRDTVVYKDTVFVSGVSAVDKYLKNAKQEVDDYIRKQQQEVDKYIEQRMKEVEEYINQGKKENDNFVKDRKKEIEEFLKSR